MSLTCLLALFLAFLPLIGNAVASDVSSDVITVGPGDTGMVRISSSGDSTMEYDIEIISGPDVDILLIDASELNDLEDGDTFHYYASASEFDSDGIHGSMSIDAGAYYFVFRNDNDASSAISYTLTFGSDEEAADIASEVVDSMFLIFALGLIAIAAVVMAYLYNEKRKAAAVNIASEKNDKSDAGDIAYCRKCGERASSDAVYCNKCGGRLR